MQILFSPAKKQNYAKWPTIEVKQPKFQAEMQELVYYLRSLSKLDIMEIMSISQTLAELNYNRFQEFDLHKMDQSNSAPAILTFQGDAYKSLAADTIELADLKWANKKVYIISGLYGLLRPLDAIQYYRLEMKTKLPGFRCGNLYEFWDQKLSQTLGQEQVINLASGEYSQACKHPNSITIDFKEQHKGTLKTIGIKAKKARGLMLRYIITNRIEQADLLKNFKDGYKYNASLSEQNKWVFVSDLSSQ